MKLIVTQTSKTKDMVYMSFAVSDTGCGMTEDMKERLFKPFEQESTSTAMKHGGSGLGLSIVKNLVEMMQGQIAVETEKDKGTTFKVDLPFGVSEQDMHPDEDKIKSIRAVIVDDDKEAAKYISMVLERIGVEHDIAHSGPELLDMLQREHDNGSGYDVCFIDWRMSEMSDEAKEAGANYFVTKPLFQSTVFNVLMMLSGGKYKKMTAKEDDFDFTGHHVLMAEDTLFNQEVAIELLHMVHMEVDCVEDGRQAVEKFEKSEPGTYDAILMDVQMPVMDGHEAAQAIRKLSREDAATIPIYAMTANAFTEDVTAALASGMNGHIAKPIDTQILYSTLQKIIK